MSLLMVGSARHDEKGKYVGGLGGDQTGSEVSQQRFYVHKKGYYILRAKSITVANKLAQAMIDVCNNPAFGYNQNDRLGIIIYLRKYLKLKDVKEYTNCDCSSAVRACVIEASGIDPGNFTTVNEVKTLEKTGLFDKHFEYKAGVVLYNGDILVTKTKGHTLIVTSGNPRPGITAASKVIGNPYPVPVRVLKKKTPMMKGNDVKWLQTELKMKVVDGYFGNDTKNAVMVYQKLHNLEVDGIVGTVTRQYLSSGR